MLKRVAISVALLPILIALMYFGGIALQIGLIVVVVIALIEFFRAFSERLKSIHFAAMVFGAAFIVRTEPMLFLLFVIVILILMVFQHKSINISDAAVAVFGFVYIAVMISTITIAREVHGRDAAYLLFIAAWGCDTGAYFVGRLIGKRKLAPNLSPNKTVAGSVGGSLTAMVLGGLYAFIIYQLDWTEHNYMFIYAAITLVCSIFAQLGDLTASVIKRHRGKKDFGRLIPGHGGILDRFDSILFTAPIALLLLNIFFNGGTQ